MASPRDDIGSPDKNGIARQFDRRSAPKLVIHLRKVRAKPYLDNF